MTDEKILQSAYEKEQDAFHKAIAIQSKASEASFDWPDLSGVIEKIHEELDELKIEIQQGAPHSKLLDELGDIYFACCNLARHLNIDPHDAINSTNQKFYRRFNYVEKQAQLSGRQMPECSLAELHMYWEQAKRLEQAD